MNFQCLTASHLALCYTVIRIEHISAIIGSLSSLLLALNFTTIFGLLRACQVTCQKNIFVFIFSFFFSLGAHKNAKEKLKLILHG